MRASRPEDWDALNALLTASFGKSQPAEDLRARRAAGQIDLELVLPWGGGLAGYLALSRLTAPEGWLSLNLLAIAPEWQAKRWGTRLVTGAMKLTAIKGQTVVAQGRPGFFTRCGFSAPRAAGLTLQGARQPLLLCRPGDDTPSETLIFPPA